MTAQTEVGAEAADKTEIAIISSGGKDCLSIADCLVAGHWTEQGRTVTSFKVTIAQLEEIIANHKRKNGSKL